MLNGVQQHVRCPSANRRLIHKNPLGVWLREVPLVSVTLSGVDHPCVVGRRGVTRFGDGSLESLGWHINIHRDIHKTQLTSSRPFSKHRGRDLAGIRASQRWCRRFRGHENGLGKQLTVWHTYSPIHCSVSYTCHRQGARQKRKGDRSVRMHESVTKNNEFSMIVSATSRDARCV